ncbi:MAG: hypothetical protein AVDCRST_MAG05-3343, partial [uncultured Rubrobacteraceae bacterium]
GAPVTFSPTPTTSTTRRKRCRRSGRTWSASPASKASITMPTASGSASA